MSGIETELEMVLRHVAHGERTVQNQLELVVRMREHGLDATRAEGMLELFREIQAEHRAHLARIT